MKKFIKGLLAAFALSVGISTAHADQVLIIDAQYSTVTANVQGRLEAAGHTVTVTTNTGLVPTATSTYQQVWDLRYAAALTSSEQTAYSSFVTNGGFAYFVTENPGCCMSRNNSVAALVTSLGGGTTQIGPGWANNVETNMNTTYMTQGITVNYLAVAAIVNAQGIPLIKDAQNNVSGMSWIGRANALNSGVTGTIVTVADVNWLAQAWGADNQQALDDIIRGIVAGTVGGTISSSGNGAAASNGAAQQQQQQQQQQPTTYSQTNANQVVVSNTMATGTFTGNGGALQAATGVTEISNNMVLNADGMTVDNNGQTLSLTGSVSGVGGWTFTNTTTGGSTTLNGTYTYTGPTNINSSATVVNNSNISSSSLLTNLGTFTNSATGTVGSWVNDGGVLNNAGVMGNGINRAIVNNSGTVGSVQNAGTFNNTGTTGAIGNSGTLNNNGTVSELSYNNSTVNNHGTITTITYNGGHVNNYSDGIIGSINNAEAHGNFSNEGTVTGTVTTNSTFVNSGSVAGLYTNGGSLTNTGTLGAVTNNSTFGNSGVAGAVTNTGIMSNSGTTGNWLNNGTVANTGTMGNGTNNSVFANTGAVGTVVNTGTFGNTGTMTSINNSGTFATTPVTLTNYTQSATGSTVLDYGSKITVTGPASLDGNLTLIGTPYTLGKYTVLTGAPVTGTYSSYNGVGVLRYTPAGVQVWVMPDGTVVQAQANAMAGNLSNANALATASINGALGSDCQSFGEKGGCVNVNYGATKVGTGDLNTAGITAVKAIDPNWRVGVFGSQNLNKPTVSGVKYEGVPTAGVLVGWTENETGTGFGVTASAVTGGGNYVIGSDKTSTDGQAYQVKATYTKGLDGTTVLTPYIGVRRSTFNVDAFTPGGQLFPITYGAVKQSTTDLLAGVSVAKKFDEKLTGTVNAGVVQNIANSAGTVTSTSDMGNFKAPLQGGSYTSAALGAGLSYEVLPNQRVSVNAGWQQKSLTNSNITSYGVGYTVGF